MNTVQAGWEVYEEVSVLSGIKAENLIFEKRAFYSGAAWLLALMDEMAFSGVSDEAASAIFNSLVDECDSETVTLPKFDMHEPFFDEAVKN